MRRLVLTEILKLRRSYMVLIGLAGSAVVPFLIFLMVAGYANQTNTLPEMPHYLNQALLFDSALVGLLLYGLLISYVFNREFQDDTMKSVLTVPVGRIGLLAAKLIVVLAWITVMMFFTVALIHGFGFLGGFVDGGAELALEYLGRFLLAGVLIFLLATPVIFISLAFRSYAAAIAFTIVVTVGTIVVMQTEYSPTFPWSAAVEIVMPVEEPNLKFAPYVKWGSVTATAAVSLLASGLYFARRDVQ